MRQRFLPITFLSFIFLFLLNYSCTKLDTTALGSDLIPVVDNINTFRDTLDINSVQGFFDDTTKVSSAEGHALGTINADPLFGTTSASVYLQLKPPFFPFYYGNATDSVLGFDSVFVTLSYIGAYGDTTVPQQIEVRQILDNNFRDSIGQLRSVKYQPSSLGPVLGSQTVFIPDLKNQVKFAHNKDSAVNQIRIKITDPAFLTAFKTSDSTDGALKSGAIFRSKFNGFAIQPANNTGRALMYLNVEDVNTRLEIHYRKLTKAGVTDTAYTKFGLLSSDSSSSANGITRGYTGYPVANPSSEYIYLQTSPGTYANITVPALTNMSNRIIHRAELIMEQVPDVDVREDSFFQAPSYLYLDLVDSTTGAAKWKPVYFDLNPSSPYDPDYKNGYPFFPLQLVDPSYFGGTRKYKTDASGRSAVYYDFNVTRYVQLLLTHTKPNYTMRIFPAFNFSYPQYSKNIIAYYNNIANGRVRLGSGTNADKKKKMKMVITWSQIK